MKRFALPFWATIAILAVVWPVFLSGCTPAQLQKFERLRSAAEADCLAAKAGYEAAKQDYLAIRTAADHVCTTLLILPDAIEGVSLVSAKASCSARKLVSDAEARIDATARHVARACAAVSVLGEDQ